MKTLTKKRPKKLVRKTIKKSLPTTLTATKARQNFFKLIELVQQPGREITITIEGEPKIIMMSVEDFEGWKETLEIMSDPEMVKGIKEGLDDVKHGRMHAWEDIKKELNLL